MNIRLVIGNRNYSSWSLRAGLLMAQSGLAHEVEVIPLDQADSDKRLSAAGPSGLVPVLHADGLVVWDSLAIAEYLAEQSPAAGIWPADPAARARARSVSAEMHSGFASLRARMPMDMRSRHPPAEPALDAEIARVVQIWSDCRETHGRGGDFLFGAWCAADAMYAPVVSRFLTYGVELPAVCADYRDALGHLTLQGAAAAGQALGAFYAERP